MGDQAFLAESELHKSPKTVSVGFIADQSQLQPGIFVAALVAQKHRASATIADQHIQVSVIVVICPGQPPADLGNRQDFATLGGDVLEQAADVLQQQFGLPVGCPRS